MKHVVRMLVAILIVGALGGGIWYFVFRDKPNEAVFKEMTASIDYVGSVSINYTETTTENGTSTIETKTAKGYENVIDVYLNKAKAHHATYDVYVTINNLKNYDEYSYETIEYYYSLTATANKVKSKDKKSLVKKIDAYNSSIKTVVNTVKDSVGLYGKAGVSNETIYQMDTILLKNMLKKQKTQTELYFALRDYVEKYVFASVTEDGSGIIPDYKSAIYNIYNNQLNIDCEKLSKGINGTIDSKESSNLFVTGNNNSQINYLYESINNLESYNYIANEEHPNPGTIINKGKNAVKFLDSYTKFYKNSKNKISELLKIDWVGFVSDVEDVNKSNTDISIKYSIPESDILDAYNVLIYIAVQY